MGDVRTEYRFLRPQLVAAKANLRESGRLEALTAMPNRPDDDAVGARLSHVTRHLHAA